MAVCALTAVLPGCREPGASVRQEDAPHLVERAHVSMGSEVRLIARTADEGAAVAAFEAAFAEFDRLDALMSVWRENSDVNRLNAAAGVAPVAISPEVAEVLRTARQVSEWSGGKFDITFGAMSDVWRFDHDQDGRIPSRAEIAPRVARVNYEELRLDDQARTAFLARPGMRVHLGGIGKGYAVDRAASILRARGLRDFMIQSGGDLYVAGSRGDGPWRVGIQDPRGPGGRSFAALNVVDAAVSTSGDYERFFISGGRRYHHILDPDTGEPARGSRSATVVAGRALLADALSTAVFVLGADEGMALIERLGSVEGVIVTPANNVAVSTGLRGRFAVLASPTDAP